ncbi:MAG: hypothetical protein H9535_04620 [Ignavibacteria bacterium]|nr:hypothetical protein [Ignavibacteria bacterium]
MNIPAQGHTNPTLAVVKELVRRGDTVIYYSFTKFQAAIESTGAEFRSYDQELPIDPDNPDPNLVRYATELLETAQLLVPQLLPRVVAEKPDAIIHDSLCAWGLIIARSLKLPSICSISTFAISPRVAVTSFRDAWDFGAMMLESASDLVKFFRIGAALRREYGFAQAVPPEMYSNFSDRNIIYTSAELQPYSASFPANFRFVGASIEEKPPDSDFAQSNFAQSNFPLPDAPQRRIYISLGTLFNNNLPFYKMCIEALSGVDARVIMSIGKKIAVQDLGTLPSNISAYSFVPQLDVLRKSDVFITHGGMNSVHEALWFGVPTVIVPQAADQKFVSKRLDALGAGIRIAKDEVNAERLRNAVEKILTTQSYKEVSTKLGDTLRRAGGAQKAADEIQDFIADRMRY